jgi:hypothetical protein
LIKSKNFLPFLITNHQINGKHSQMDVNSTAQLAKYAKNVSKCAKNVSNLANGDFEGD